MKGSHNTLTFAQPRSWWARIFTPVWRCQRRNIQAQIDVGCRAFDIRFAPKPGFRSPWPRKEREWALPIGVWTAAHGCIDLDYDPIIAVMEINTTCKGAAVRLILERSRGTGDESDFRDTCAMLEKRFPALVFFEGRRKKGWKHLYRFNRKNESLHYEQTLIQHVGSMQSRWGKILPGLWAYFHRRLPVEAASPDTPIVLVDMV